MGHQACIDQSNTVTEQKINRWQSLSTLQSIFLLFAIPFNFSAGKSCPKAVWQDLTAASDTQILDPSYQLSNSQTSLRTAIYKKDVKIG